MLSRRRPCVGCSVVSTGRSPVHCASPGGWGWSNLSGAVPDADDTPAALLAISRWVADPRHRTSILMRHIEHAVGQALVWLLNLQNRDGGWPTFCRGWASCRLIEAVPTLRSCAARTSCMAATGRSASGGDSASHPGAEFPCMRCWI